MTRIHDYHFNTRDHGRVRVSVSKTAVGSDFYVGGVFRDRPGQGAEILVQSMTFTRSKASQSLADAAREAAEQALYGKAGA